MRWGPKKEASLQLSRQLPPIPDATVDQDEGMRLQYLATIYIPSWNFGLFQKLVAMYGPTIACPSLRLATLAWFDVDLPYGTQGAQYIVRTVEVLGKTSISDLSEGDLLAVALVAISIRFYFLRNKSDLPGSVQFPSSSLQLRWFTAILKGLLLKGEASHTFGEAWLHMIFTVVLSAPFDFQGSAFWELLEACRPFLRPANLNYCTEYFRKQLAVHPMNIQTSNSWQNQEAWEITINLNFKIVLIAFSTVLKREIDQHFQKPELLQLGLEDARERSNATEASAIHRRMLFDFWGSPLPSLPTIEQPFCPMSHVQGFLTARMHDVTQLLLRLLLDGPTIQQAATVSEVVQCVTPVVLDSQIVLSFGSSVTDYARALHLLFVVIAAIVHPVSQMVEGIFLFQCTADYSWRGCNGDAQALHCN